MDDDKNCYSYRLENHKALKFGTSGLRDEDSKLTDMQVYISTKGFLSYLFSLENGEGGISRGSKVALAGDFRPSTPRILVDVSAGIIDSGCEVDFCGRVPTPTVSLWGFKNKIPSIMVTASHNPYGQNGVKFFRPDREILKEEEKPILNEISKVREEEYKKSWEESMFSKEGFFKKFENLNVVQQFSYYSAKKSVMDDRVNNKAKEFYIDRYKKAFGKALVGEKLVFYEQTSVGREIIPEILEHLGAEVIRAGRVDETKEFVPIDTEDIKENILEKMANFAIENNCFICITADGDADRPAILFIRKDNYGKHKYRNGRPHTHHIMGDKLNVLIAVLLNADFVAVPIHANYKLVELMRKNGIEVKITKVGAPYIVKAILERIEEEKRKHEEKGVKIMENEILEKLFLYSFERNGGAIIFSSKSFYEKLFNENNPQGGLEKLEILPTRDAVFPIVCSLVLARKKGLDLESLFNEVFCGEFESYSYSGLVENLEGIKVTPGCERYSSEVGKKLIETFSPIKKEIIEVDFENSVRFKDFDGNFLNFDKEVSDHVLKIKEILTYYLRELIGEDVLIYKINYLDGIKISLSNKEVAYLRPSGNANQFRFYSETNSEERAFLLVEKAVKPVYGVLVRLINDFIDGKINL